MYLFKGMCYFTSGTPRVQLVAIQIYNEVEIVRFDSDLGVLAAVIAGAVECSELEQPEEPPGGVSAAGRHIVQT